jgi:RNA polymerase sigma factor (sigma-70 family)
MAQEPENTPPERPARSSAEVLMDGLTDHYGHHRNAFVSWARKEFNADIDEARDAFQEAVCIFFEQHRHGQLNGHQGNLRTYLFAIGRNHLLTRLRSRAISGNHSATYAIHVRSLAHHTAQENMEREQDLENVRNELERLGPDDRRVLQLYYIDRLDMRGIADAMGYKNANVAKKKKCIAMKRLMEQVKKGMMMML